MKGPLSSTTSIMAGEEDEGIATKGYIAKSMEQKLQ